jgi:hypothetical protein
MHPREVAQITDLASISARARSLVKAKSSAAAQKAAQRETPR